MPVFGVRPSGDRYLNQFLAPDKTYTSVGQNICPPIRSDQFRPAGLPGGVLCPDPISIPDLLRKAGITCEHWRGWSWNLKLYYSTVWQGATAVAPSAPGPGPGHVWSPTSEQTRAGTALAHAIDAYCLGQGIHDIGEAKAMNTATNASMARTQKPSGSVSDWWNSEPIVFTSKNYVVGGAVGLLAGALAMHLSMKMKKR